MVTLKKDETDGNVIKQHDDACKLVDSAEQVTHAVDDVKARELISYTLDDRYHDDTRVLEKGKVRIRKT
jgi:hypothetical protein